MPSEPRKDRDGLGEIVVQFKEPLSGEQCVRIIARLFRPLYGRYGSPAAVSVRWSDRELTFTSIRNRDGSLPYLQDVVAFVDEHFYPLISRMVFRERWAVLPVAEDWGTRVSFMRADSLQNGSGGPMPNYTMPYTERAIVLASYGLSRSSELRKMTENEIVEKLAEQLTQQGIDSQQLFVEQFPIPAGGFGPSAGLPFPDLGESTDVIRTDSPSNL